MGSPYWIKTVINKTFSQRFFLSRLSNYPLIGRLVERALFEGDDIFYLPKDNVVPVNTALTQETDLVVPSRVLEHFIRRAGFIWIMDFCICRDSEGCRDYPVDLGCMFLGEAARDINPRFGREATVEEALAHAARCREAGLVHLIGRNKLDTVWLQVGPGDRLLTVCNCCPCCCLWKVLPNIAPQIGEKIRAMPGVRVTVGDDCIGCGTCLGDVCFVGAISLEKDRAVINPQKCRGCGRCVEICPQQAIRLTMEESDLVQRAIERIEAVVDVG